MITSTYDWNIEPDVFELREAYEMLSSDKQAAMVRLRNLASRGSVMSMIYLGYAIANQKASAQHNEEALKWYQRAAASGYPFAIYNLCKMLHMVGKFDDELRLLEAEKLTDYAPALNQLGNIYKAGLCVRKNLPRAEQFYQKACKMGHITAMRNLGTVYSSGAYGFAKIPLGLELFFASLPSYVREHRSVGPYSERLI